MEECGLFEKRGMRERERERESKTFSKKKNESDEKLMRVE